MGRDERIDLTRVSFPAVVSHCLPQAVIFALILLIIYIQWGALVVPKVKGKPRYLNFSQDTYSMKPRAREILRIDCWSTAQPYTPLFLLLTIAPKTLRKLWITPLKALVILIEAQPKSLESSANKAWLIGVVPGITLMPGRVPLSFSSESFWLRESAIRMYKKGDRGQPCLIPLVALK